jgi:hypothetical protein
MQIGNIFKVDENIIRGTSASGIITLSNKIDNIDTRYLKPKYWKINNAGSLENTWCRFYLDSPTKQEDIGQILEQAFNLKGGFTTTELNNQLPILDGREFDGSCVVFGVSISVSKAPRYVETFVRGFSTPVYQSFSDNAYDITISFLESGTVFWQQNSHSIRDLLNILNSPFQLKISNPQLDLIYEISDVVVTNYSIGQDPRFYSHNNISITLRSVINQDLIQRTIKTIK